MRRILAAAIALLAIAFCLVAGFDLVSQNELSRSLRTSLASVGERGSAMSREFIALLPARDEDPYYAEVARSIESAAAAAGAAVRFLDYRPGAPELVTPSDPASLGRLVASISFMGVDGLILAVPDSPEIVAAIDACDAAGIPVITLEFDSPSSRRKAYIGENNFSVGYKAGSVAAGLKSTGVRAVLVMPEPSTVSAGYTESFRLGFLSVVQGRRDFRLLEMTTAPNTPIAGENMVRGILARHPDANALILTTLRDTLGAAQALIDLNKVGEVSLIGLADSPETRDYVRNGVIAAALVRDPAAAGRKCVETLLELDRNRNASAFVDTGIGVLTARGMSRDGGYRP